MPKNHRPLSAEEVRKEELAKLQGPRTRHLPVQRQDHTRLTKAVIFIVLGIIVTIWIYGKGSTKPTAPESASQTSHISVTDYGEESSAHAICKQYVQDQLNFPLEASFPWGPDYSNLNEINGMWYIRSHVDAKNAFGMKTRHTYECKVEHKEEDRWTLLSLRISE